MCGGAPADEFEEGGRVWDSSADGGEWRERERVVDCAAECGGGGEDEPREGSKAEDAHGWRVGLGWVARGTVGTGSLIVSV